MKSRFNYMKNKIRVIAFAFCISMTLILISGSADASYRPIIIAFAIASFYAIFMALLIGRSKDL